MASLIYTTATGEAVSIGTVIADPLPNGLTVFPLTAPQFQGLRDGTLRWDAPTRDLVAVPPDPTITVTNSLLTKANTGMAANDAWLALATPTNAQAVAYLDTVAKELTALIKLVTGETFGQRNNLADEGNT